MGGAALEAARVSASNFTLDHFVIGLGGNWAYLGLGLLM